MSEEARLLMVIIKQLDDIKKSLDNTECGVVKEDITNESKIGRKS